MKVKNEADGVQSKKVSDRKLKKILTDAAEILGITKQAPTPKDEAAQLSMDPIRKLSKAGREMKNKNKSPDRVKRSHALTMPDCEKSVTKPSKVVKLRGKGKVAPVQIFHDSVDED